MCVLYGVYVCVYYSSLYVLCMSTGLRVCIMGCVMCNVRVYMRVVCVGCVCVKVCTCASLHNGWIVATFSSTISLHIVSIQ